MEDRISDGMLRQILGADRCSDCAPSCNMGQNRCSESTSDRNIGQNRCSDSDRDIGRSRCSERASDRNMGQNRCSECKPDCDMGHDRHKSWGLEGYPLAMMYSPIQNFGDLYDLDTALMQGTVFEELDLPFMGETVTRGGGCRG